MLVKKINAYFVNRNEKVAEFGAMETLKIEQMNSFKNILIAFLIFLSSSVFGQAVGDFGSIASGNYNASTTWGIWNGGSWTAAPGGGVAGVNYPDKSTNVFITSGTVVIMNASNLQSNTLTVDAGGKIWTNSGTNAYLNIHGNIVCNGMMGNGVTFDGLSLGIESAVCNVTGTGTIDVSRIRKNTTTNLVTQFNINRDINIRFNSSSQVQIYNNSANTRFDVTIGAGATLNLTASGALTGNAAIDGDLVGGGATQSAGSFTINGTMIVTGTTYLVTNNSSTNITGNSTTAGSTTVTATSTAAMTVGATVIGTGTGLGVFPYGTVITAIVNGTTYTVSNPALTTVSGFSINTGGACSWTINSGGILKTAQVSTAFSTLTCTTVLASVVVTTTSTVGLTIGMGVVGTGIPLGATITAILTATTFQISSGASAAGTNAINVGGGNAGHLLRVNPGGTLEITGSSGFNFALPTVNNTYDIQSGSFTEYSAPGAQNVPLIPAATSTAFGNSTNAYGYLKISGTGLKNMFVSGIYKIANDLNIVNTSGTPTLVTNNQIIQMLGGNWYNYNQSGFDEGFGTVFFMGSNLQTITTTGGERFYRLTFQKTLNSTLQFNCPVNVINILAWVAGATYNGPIFLNGNRLTIENPVATAINNGASAGKYIISETINNSSIVQWNIGTVASVSTYVIPFGKPGVPDYIPFTYSIAAGTTVGNLSVATYGTLPSNLPLPVSPYIVTNLGSLIGLLPNNQDATVDRFWEIDATAATPPVATVTFVYAPSELPSIVPYNDPNQILSQWYDKPTDSWMPSIPGQSSTTFQNTTPGLNTYGAWTLSALVSPLPIKLLSFSAKPNNEDVDLNWTTATEINNDFFTIERSANGKDFSPIGIKKGAGNSTTVLSYATIDEEPLPGISYYRLKQTDFDGKFSYSNIIAVKFSGDQRVVIQAGPIPANDKIILTCFGAEHFSPELYQIDGRLVKIYPNVSDGLSELDISDLSKGSYILRVKSDFNQKSLRVIKE